MSTNDMHEHYVFRFDTLEKKIDKTNSSLETILKTQQADIKELFAYVKHGNGKPPILQRLEVVEGHIEDSRVARETEIAERKAEQAERKADRKKMWYAIGSMLFVFFLPKLWLIGKASFLFFAAL